MESGKHADLMARQGEYYQLVTVQMLVEEEMEEGIEGGDCLISKFCPYNRQRYFK